VADLSLAPVFQGINQRAREGYPEKNKNAADHGANYANN
jgi:hypothetical protein